MIDIRNCIGDKFLPTPSTQWKIDRTSSAFLENLARPETQDRMWSKRLIEVETEVSGKVVTGFQRGGK